MKTADILARLQAPDTIPLQADGSSRRFFRLPGKQPLLAVLPPEHPEPKDFAEARSMALIGRHLRQKGAAVPEIHDWDEQSGLVLCEDLGDQRLHGASGDASSRLALYEAAVTRLAQMQTAGAEDFDPGWCWDTPRYDEALMQDRESGYFLRACCTELLGLTFDKDQLAAECQALAQAASSAPAHFFLHRDCQSRNIMLVQEQPFFIDFQGGRLGPLAYDLASLLLDPYAALPKDIQAHLLNSYLAALHRLMPYDADQFRHEFLLLSAQRNLQILGAFAFLSHTRGKPFFARFLAPASASLAALLAREEFARYAGLRSLACQCHQQFKQS